MLQSKDTRDTLLLHKARTKAHASFMPVHSLRYIIINKTLHLSAVMHAAKAMTQETHCWCTRHVPRRVPHPCPCTRDGHRIPKCSPCPFVVFLMPPGPSVRFRVFLGGGEYVCPSYGLLKFLKSAKSGRKPVCPFVKKLRNPFLPSSCKKMPKV